MKDLNQKPEAILGRAFVNLIKRSAMIESFWEVGASIGEGREARVRLQVEKLNALKTNAALWETMIDIGEASDHPDEIERFAESTNRKMEGHFQEHLEAASLVFTHSVLDQIVEDCCIAAIICAPERWLRYVGGKNISLNDALSGKAKEKLSIEAVRNLSERENSLIKKLSKLLEVCSPTTVPKDPSYEFDIQRIKALHGRRVNIVHEDGPVRLPNGKADIDYLVRTGAHCIAVCANAFSVAPDPIPFLPKAE